jgi:hypothetical protein
MLNSSRRLVVTVMLPVFAALSLAASFASEAGARVAGPPTKPALKKGARHPQPIVRPRTRPSRRVVATSSAVFISDGPNYDVAQFNGCSAAYASGGLWWSYCSTSHFFGGEAQYTDWDYYYYASGSRWVYYRTYRCIAHGSCFWRN